MTIVEASNAFDAFAGGLLDVVRDVMDSHKGQIVGILQAQMKVGEYGSEG